MTRLEFEKWAKLSPPMNLDRDGDDEYKNEATDFAWKVWRAALATKNKPRCEAFTRKSGEWVACKNSADYYTGKYCFHHRNFKLPVPNPPKLQQQ